MISLSSISLYNSIAVITLEDNLAHTYMIDLLIDKDNSLPVGYCAFVVPYNEEILKYWSTYNGIVVIHSKLVNDNTINNTITNLPNSSLKSKDIKKIKLKREKNKIELEKRGYNFSFIGRIHRIKHRGNKIIIKLEDLGWKFIQKVPMTFRKNFIASKPIGDAFENMCDFMGVKFACNKTELNKYSFAADGYSIEKNGTIIEEVPNIFDTITGGNETNTDEDLANGLDDGTNESGSLPQSTIKNTSQQNIALNSTEDEDIIDEEFEEKMEDLFNGNVIYDSDLISNVLNYNNIKIQSTDTSIEKTEENNTITTTNNNNE